MEGEVRGEVFEVEAGDAVENGVAEQLLSDTKTAWPDGRHGEGTRHADVG